MILQLLLGAFAWLLVGSIFLSLWKTTKAGIVHLKKLHQVPCSRCAFFTGDYRLKCTVNPLMAMSEEAINCRDFEPKSPTLDLLHKYKIPQSKILSSKIQN
jgi:hypothetical protein